jgi:hypothetical protein
MMRKREREREREMMMMMMMMMMAEVSKSCNMVRKTKPVVANFEDGERRL